MVGVGQGIEVVGVGQSVREVEVEPDTEEVEHGQGLRVEVQLSIDEGR